MTRLAITLLGGLEIRPAGAEAPLAFPTRKCKALLAYLALSPGMSRSREHLAGVLWQRSADAQARASLRQTLSSLRKVLAGPGHPVVDGDADTIWVDARSLVVDALNFERLLMRQSIESLQDAVAVYRGDLLEGFGLNEEAFETWVATERRRLRGLAIRALSDLLAHESRADNLDRGARIAERLLAIDPLQEWAHAALMRLYARMGQRDAALRQYRECERVLERELGIEPAPETQALADSIARGSAKALLPDDPVSERETEAGDEPLSLFPAERKQITVLCARMRQPLDGLDPEAALMSAAPALDAMVDAVRQFGGAVSHMRADGVTALFGVPRADEDHAIRACYAALEIRDSPGVPADRTPDLRIAIHSGEAVVRMVGDERSRHFDAVGAVAQMANNLDAALDPGSIALTRETCRRTEGFVNLSSPRMVSIDGAQEPVELFMLESRSPLRLRWEARAGRELTPFVGREAEMTQLRELLTRAAAGSGQVATVVGEPGVGKSRVVHELVNSPMVSDWTVLETGTTAVDSGATYMPLAALMQAWFGIAVRDAPDAAAAKLRDGVADLDTALMPLMPSLLALLDLPVTEPRWVASSPAQKRRHTLDAVRNLLLSQAQVRPVLVVVEDLHWVDEGTQAVLDHLVEAVGAARMLLLFTHRPEYRHAWLGRSYFSLLRLDPLDRAQADRLLGDLVGGDPGLAQLREQLIEHTEGTPLFLEESVRALAETGALAGEQGAYRLTRPLAEFRIPSTVQALLAARIDSLPARAKSMLQTAAVVGKDVPAELLRPLAGIAHDEFLETVAELQAAEFLYQTRLLPEPEFTFKHALTHQVAYESLLAAHRRTAHRDLLRIMESLYSGRLDEHVERLAHHAQRGEITDKAVHYLLQSATRAMQRSAHPRAVDYLQAGLGLIGKLRGPEQRLRMELEYQKALGVNLMAAKGWAAPEVLNAYTRAQALCEELGDEHELFIALRGEGQYRMIRGESDVARRLGDRCAELAKGSKGIDVVIETHHLFWTNSFFMGDYADADRHCCRGIELYEADRDHELTFRYSGHDPGVCCRCFSALIRCLRGRPDEALRLCEESLALANRLDHPLTTALAHWARAYVHMFRREPEAAAESAEKEIAVCEAYLLPLLHSHGLFQAGWAQAQLGRVEAGIERMREGIEANKATGAEMGAPYFAALLGEALGMAGSPDEGIREIDEALRIADENGARFQVSEMLRLKGELLQALSLSREAETFFRRSMEAAAEQGAGLPGLGSSLSLARLLKEQGRTDQARSILRRAIDGIAEGHDLHDVREARSMIRSLGSR